jgi:hypothetical protein
VGLLAYLLSCGGLNAADEPPPQQDVPQIVSFTATPTAETGQVVVSVELKIRCRKRYIGEINWASGNDYGKWNKTVFRGAPGPPVTEMFTHRYDNKDIHGYHLEKVNIQVTAENEYGQAKKKVTVKL